MHEYDADIWVSVILCCSVAITIIIVIISFAFVFSLPFNQKRDEQQHAFVQIIYGMFQKLFDSMDAFSLFLYICITFLSSLASYLSHCCLALCILILHYLQMHFAFHFPFFYVWTELVLNKKILFWLHCSLFGMLFSSNFFSFSFFFITFISYFYTDSIFKNRSNGKKMHGIGKFDAFLLISRCIGLSVLFTIYMKSQHSNSPQKIKKKPDGTIKI